MMRALLLGLALACSATAAQAQQWRDETGLGALEGCWVGAFAGSELRDERCFTRVNGGKQWRDVHTVVGAGYGGETIYAWDAEHDRIDVMYYANDGGLMRGHGMNVQGGIAFEARYVGPRGRAQNLRSRWDLPAWDRFDVVTEAQEGGCLGRTHAHQLRAHVIA